MTIAERKSLFIVLPTFYPRWPEKPATSTPVLLASGFSVWTMLLGCEAERLVLTKLENTEVSKAWKYKFPADHQMNQLASILNPSHQLQSHANKKHLHPH